jgi:hypothetical protein
VSRSAARWAILGVVGLVIALSIAGTDYALAQHSASLRSTVTLWIALGALLVSVAKVLLDLFVAPEDQAARQRTARHEERVESAAGRVRQLLGLTGTILVSRIDEAWIARAAERLAESARTLGDVAQQAYQEIETTSDPIEILIGVLMIEAWELADAAPTLAATPSDEWAASPAAAHRRTVIDYLDQVQRALHEIQDRGRPDSKLPG